MLEGIVYRGAPVVIEQIFQYDIMKLLHSTINLSHLPPISLQHTSSDSFLDEAVADHKFVSRVRDCEDNTDP